MGTIRHIRYRMSPPRTQLLAIIGLLHIGPFEPMPSPVSRVGACNRPGIPIEHSNHHHYDFPVHFVGVPEVVVEIGIPVLHQDPVVVDALSRHHTGIAAPLEFISVFRNSSVRVPEPLSVAQLQMGRHVQVSLVAGPLHPVQHPAPVPRLVFPWPETAVKAHIGKHQPNVPRVIVVCKGRFMGVILTDSPQAARRDLGIQHHEWGVPLYKSDLINYDAQCLKIRCMTKFSHAKFLQSSRITTRLADMSLCSPCP